MLTLSTMKRVMRMEAALGKYEGSCFGTPIADRLRPRTTPRRLARIKSKEKGIWYKIETTKNGRFKLVILKDDSKKLKRAQIRAKKDKSKRRQ